MIAKDGAQESAGDPSNDGASKATQPARSFATTTSELTPHDRTEEESDAAAPQGPEDGAPDLPWTMSIAHNAACDGCTKRWRRRVRNVTLRGDPGRADKAGRRLGPRCKGR